MGVESGTGIHPDVFLPLGMDKLFPFEERKKREEGMKD